MKSSDVQSPKVIKYNNNNVPKSPVQVLCPSYHN